MGSCIVEEFQPTEVLKHHFEDYDFSKNTAENMIKESSGTYGKSWQEYVPGGFDNADDWDFIQ